VYWHTLYISDAFVFVYSVTHVSETVRLWLSVRWSQKASTSHSKEET